MYVPSKQQQIIGVDGGLNIYMKSVYGIKPPVNVTLTGA